MNEIVISNAVADFADKIRTSWRQAVESILLTASLLKEAQETLSPSDWFDLQGEVPFSQSATVKLLSIAQDVRLHDPKNIELLPPAWTTLYEISTLPDDQFNSGVDMGLINSKMLRQE